MAIAIAVPLVTVGSVTLFLAAVWLVAHLNDKKRKQHSASLHTNQVRQHNERSNDGHFQDRDGSVLRGFNNRAFQGYNNALFGSNRSVFQSYGGRVFQGHNNSAFASRITTRESEDDRPIRQFKPAMHYSGQSGNYWNWWKRYSSANRQHAILPLNRSRLPQHRL